MDPKWTLIGSPLKETQNGAKSSTIFVSTIYYRNIKEPKINKPKIGATGYTKSSPLPFNSPPTLR